MSFVRQLIFLSKELFFVEVFKFLSVVDLCLYDTALCNLNLRHDYHDIVHEPFSLNTRELNLESINQSTFILLGKWSLSRGIKYNDISIAILIELSSLLSEHISTMESIFGTSRHVLEVVGCEFMSPVILEHLFHCPMLKSLDLTYSNLINPLHCLHLPPDIPDIQLVSLKRLSFTNVRDDYMLPLLFVAPNLHELVIKQSTCFEYNAQISKQFFGSLSMVVSTQLRSLQFDGLTDMNGIDYVVSRKLGQIIRQLHTFAFTNHNFADSTVNALLQQCNKHCLTELNLSNSSALTSYTISSILKYCPKLSICNLSDCVKMNQRSLLKLVVESKALTYLDVSGTLIRNKTFLRSIADIYADLTLRTLRIECDHYSHEQYYRDVLLLNCPLQLEIRKCCVDGDYYELLVKPVVLPATLLIPHQDRHVGCLVGHGNNIDDVSSIHSTSINTLVNVNSVDSENNSTSVVLNYNVKSIIRQLPINAPSIVSISTASMASETTHGISDSRMLECHTEESVKQTTIENLSHCDGNTSGINLLISVSNSEQKHKHKVRKRKIHTLSQESNVSEVSALTNISGFSL